MLCKRDPRLQLLNVWAGQLLTAYPWPLQMALTARGDSTGERRAAEAGLARPEQFFFKKFLFKKRLS